MTMKGAKRIKAGLLPSSFFRTFYEGSITLSRYVTADCLPKHRDVPHLKSEKENAIHGMADFVATRDMTPERIEEQLDSRQRQHPSSFISALNNYVE
jgi:endo-1,4-beta-D-glucanase Y